MINITKVEEIDLDALNTEDTHLLLKIHDLEEQITELEAPILTLQKDREAAWTDYQAALEELHQARKNFLIKVRPGYKEACESYCCFQAQHKTKSLEIKHSIELEKHLIDECTQNMGEKDDNYDFWKRCKDAHEKRLKLYREELATYNQYASKRSEEFAKIELDAEYDINFTPKADPGVVSALDNLGETKQVLADLDSQILHLQNNLKDILKSYNEALEKHSQLFSNIKALDDSL